MMALKLKKGRIQTGMVLTPMAMELVTFRKNLKTLIRAMKTAIVTELAILRRLKKEPTLKTILFILQAPLLILILAVLALAV